MESADLEKTIRISQDGISIDCWIQPKSSKSSFAGIHGDSLKIKIAATPEDGRANEELCSFLAKKLEISKSSVQIKSGHASRRKIIFCSGATKEKLQSLIQ
ncbi:MAG TPA: YggU family protein [Lentisphaeria bacterium]|nr:MAG: YggU family protein [Lentisphaerae bacterium GWF2_50_93]HCE43194.1 YggU family protein [Lentisphaeria bacterium]